MSWPSLEALWRPVSRALKGSGQGPEARWVVIDVETTGLDTGHDALLAIGAVALSPAGIDVGDSFEVAVRPPAISERSNILIHRIGAAAQAAGEAPEVACRRFLDYAGDSPLVGFHVGFDRAFLTRALRNADLAVPRRWLDLAALAPALHPGVAAHALDEWLAIANLSALARHAATSDAMATAMLFQWLLGKVPPPDRYFGKLRGLAGSARWVAPSNRV